MWVCAFSWGLRGVWNAKWQCRSTRWWVEAWMRTTWARELQSWKGMTGPQGLCLYCVYAMHAATHAQMYFFTVWGRFYLTDKRYVSWSQLWGWRKASVVIQLLLRVFPAIWHLFVCISLHSIIYTCTGWRNLDNAHKMMENISKTLSCPVGCTTAFDCEKQ